MTEDLSSRMPATDHNTFAGRRSGIIAINDVVAGSSPAPSTRREGSSVVEHEPPLHPLSAILFWRAEGGGLSIKPKMIPCMPRPALARHDLQLCWGRRVRVIEPGANGRLVGSLPDGKHPAHTLPLQTFAGRRGGLIVNPSVAGSIPASPSDSGRVAQLAEQWRCLLTHLSAFLFRGRSNEVIGTWCAQARAGANPACGVATAVVEQSVDTPGKKHLIHSLPRLNFHGSKQDHCEIRTLL